ncbi:MAG: hypothetical protein WA081_19555 [Desulfosalsimonadaceae bacterium]
MTENRIKKQARNNFLKHLTQEEKDQFLNDLVSATKSGDQLAALDCLESWREIADLNRIPGLKNKVWDRFNALKESGKVC